MGVLRPFNSSTELLSIFKHFMTAQTIFVAHSSFTIQWLIQWFNELPNIQCAPLSKFVFHCFCPSSFFFLWALGPNCRVPLLEVFLRRQGSHLNLREIEMMIKLKLCSFFLARCSFMSIVKVLELHGCSCIRGHKHFQQHKVIMIDLQPSCTHRFLFNASQWNFNSRFWIAYDLETLC